MGNNAGKVIAAQSRGAIVESIAASIQFPLPPAIIFLRPLQRIDNIYSFLISNQLALSNANDYYPSIA
jgi:hypothetical protein